MAIVQQPTAISLSGNLLPFIVHKTELINFTLMDGDITLIEATYEPDSMGKVTIDVRDIIESRLKFEKKADAFYEQPEIVKQFTAIVDTDTVTFKVIRCEVLDLEDTSQNWLTGNFLTWQSQQKAVTYYSPEWLTYYATQQCTIKLKAQFPGEAEQNITLGSCQAGRAFTFNMQYAHIAGLLGHKYPSYYDVWAEDTAGRRLSYVQRYYHSEVKSEQEQWICFENSLGGIDTLRATGETDLESQSEHKTALIDGAFAEYKVDTKRVYTKNTGHLTDYERRWLFDFPAARVKYIYHAGGFRQIAVTDTSDFKYSISDLPSSFSFKYRFVNQSSALNLVRNEGDIPDNITIPDESAPDFFLPPRLSEFPRVALSEDTLIPAFDPYNLTPTVTTAGHIIQSAVAESLANIPGAGVGGTMVQVLTENSELAVTDRNVFSSKRTLKEIAKGLANSFEEFVTSMKAMFLRKDVADTAKGLITFLKGAMFGNFSSGIHTGRGARIDEEGNLEAQSAVLRSFLEVPSIKYNQLEVLGEETGIGAGGIIEEVDKITTPEGDIYRVKLKLKEGAANEFQRDDIVKGIFHQFEDLQEGELAGFQTSWFRVQSTDGAYMDLVMGADSEVPGGKNYPPRKFMNIAKRGNFTVKERQFSIILSSKTGNIVMYDGVDNYKSGTVVSQWGKPSGLEFIDGYQDLPINHDEALQYVKTLLVENIVRIDVNGVVKKEITDRGAWSLATAQSDEPYLNNEEHIHEVWHKAAKYRCIVNMTLNEPSPNSPDWIQIFEIEGVVGDSVRFKYKNSIAKPERPTGDGDGWRDTPDNDGPAPEVPLVPIGPNLYDRQYLLNQGWAVSSYAAIHISGREWSGYIIDSGKFKEGKQYRYQTSRFSQDYTGGFRINYSDGTFARKKATEDWDTEQGKTVTSITGYVPPNTSQIIELGDDTQFHELGEGAVSVETLWFSQQSTVNGVTTPWSDPSPWLTEGGQPGEPGKAPEIRNGYWWAYNNSTNDWYNTWVKAEGKDGIDGVDGKPGKGINLKPAVANYAALPPAYQNAIDDARVTLDTGHLWVWDGTQWNDNGPFKGQDGENGVNYLNMGNWDINMVYRITDLGIPMVRVPIGSTGNYTVYTLKVTNSTPGVQPSTQQGLTEWKLIDSDDMRFMEQAYIQKLQAQLITAERIEALNINARKIVSEDNMGNMIASMNIAGDGAYIQYYSSGRKKMEFNDGLIIYYDDNEANSVLWQLGRSGSITSGSLDRWASVMLVATDESGSNIKEQYITGVQWKRFMTGSPSSYPTYSGLTVNKDTALHSIPSNIPSSAYIPNGWYANAGDSGMIIDGGYYREVVYYQSGFPTGSTIIITF